MKKDIIDNPRAIFDRAVREADSNFAIYTEKEIQEGLENFEDLLEVYGEENFKRLIKSERQLYGYTTQIFAIKE